MTATARALAELPEADRRAVLGDLTAAELATLEFEWKFWARTGPIAP